MLVNGATRTSGVHTAVLPMNIDLLWAIKFLVRSGNNASYFSEMCLDRSAVIKIDLL